MEISNIFKKINSSSLSYVLISGNTNINNSIQGKSDFDLLVKKSDRQAFELLILNLGFKRRISTFDNFYFGVDNFLFYDDKNEMIHHFHIHYDLIFGQKNDLRYYVNDSSFCYKSCHFVLS